VLDIDGGQPWKRYLAERIEHSDLFQLFWSTASAASEYVEKEWRQALDVAERRPPGTFFVRPVYWTKPLPAPPRPLADLHFRYVDPQELGVTAPNTSYAGTAGTATRLRRADVHFPVIPLVSDPYGTTAERIREALRTIVPFLEDVSGLRYYPPVTYLIDEATVVDLRKTTEPDANRPADQEPRNPNVDPPALPPDQEDTVQRLQRLLLTFHNHMNRDLAPGSIEFSHVRREAEGGFASNVRRYLGGHRPRAYDPSNDYLARQCLEDFQTYSHRYVELLLEYVQRDLQTPNARRLSSGMRTGLRSQLGGAGDRIADRLERGGRGHPIRDATEIDHNYQRKLRQACDQTLNLIGAQPAPSHPPAFLRVATPTFGVFRYRGGVGRTTQMPAPTVLNVPTTAPAALVCVNAFERIVNGLRAEGVPDVHARERAEQFLVSTLVHEHAHAVLATGLDSDGLAAATVGTGLWMAGARLNEALAAWVQRHFYRGDPDMFDECTRYIETDAYPGWPYRGASTLEQHFASNGVVEIRRFMRMLREAPDLAQREFDTLTHST